MKTPKTALLLSMVMISPSAAFAENQGLTQAMALLGSTATGQEALEMAKRLGVPIQLGRTSKTEITATRELVGGAERLEFQSTVVIAQDKAPVFQALDLAHELTHATHPKKNPFDPNLNANDYIRHGIEGEGGEAKAIRQECQVGKEIVDAQSRLAGNAAGKISNEAEEMIKARCQFVWKTESDSNRWTQSFYFLGHHYRNFLTMIRGTGVNLQTMKVEEKSPMFSSAVAHKPYPLALLEEYIEITRTICSRSKSTALGRKLASIGGDALQQRCKEISE